MSSYRAQQNTIPIVIPELSFDKSAFKPVVSHELSFDKPAFEQVKPSVLAENGDTPEKIKAWTKEYLDGKKKKKKKTELNDEGTEEIINQFADTTDPETEAMNDIIKGYRDRLQTPTASFNSHGGYTFPGFFNG